MKSRLVSLVVAALLITIAVAAPGVRAQRKHQNAVIDIWTQGKPVFGVYVPSMGQPLWSEPSPQPNPAAARGGQAGFGQRGTPQVRPDPVYTKDIGEALAKDPLVDFAFLNLEGGYDASGAKAIIDGLRSPGTTHRVTLIVRIPSIQDAGADKTRVRVKQLLDMGADGVTHPENRGLDDAKLAMSFYADAKADVWSPMNPNGEKLAMIMLEDPTALMQAKDVADMRNFSIMACGIGSLGGAFQQGGIVRSLVAWEFLTQAQATTLNELGTQKLLAESKRVGIPNMLTASANKDAEGVPNVVKRVKEGFLALLMSGPGSDDAIKLGRAAAGR
jgi:hypothetical protein